MDIGTQEIRFAATSEITGHKASPGKFLIIAMIDSDTYRVNEEQGTLENALEIARTVTDERNVPLQIYNDKGEPHFVSAEEYSKRILVSFETLCKKSDPAVIAFQETYKERSRTPGFPEVRLSMTTNLIHILRELPPESYFESKHNDARSEAMDPEFAKKFTESIGEIGKKMKYVFDIMQRFNHRPMDELLPALFRFYADNPESLPF